MKAILEFDLPEERVEHISAVKGMDAILVIDDLLNEIRSYLRYGSGEFKEWRDPEDGNIHSACDVTLEKVRSYIWELRKDNEIPDLP
jgi:hypothetical protein